MDQQIMSWLWQNALGVIPVVCVAAIICRIFPVRPATKHAIWTGVLVAFLLPPVFSSKNLPTLPTLAADQGLIDIRHARFIAADGALVFESLKEGQHGRVGNMPTALVEVPHDLADGHWAFGPEHLHDLELALAQVGHLEDVLFGWLFARPGVVRKGGIYDVRSSILRRSS